MVAKSGPPAQYGQRREAAHAGPSGGSRDRLRCRSNGRMATPAMRSASASRPSHAGPPPIQRRTSTETSAVRARSARWLDAASRPSSASRSTTAAKRMPTASACTRRAVCRTHEGEHLRVGDEYYVLASSLASRRRKHVLAHQDTFAVLDQSGDIPLALEEEMGVFFRGTRHLSQLELLAGGRPPFFLSSAVTPDNLRSVANLTNNDVREDERYTPRSTLSIRRTTLLCGPQLLVRLVLHSFPLGPLAMRLELRLSADFADVFQVRGLSRVRRVTHEPPRTEGGSLVFAYQGLDGVRRLTRCEITGADVHWEGRQALLDLVLAPEEERVVDLAITCLNDEAPPPPRLGFTGAEAVREREHRLWQGELTTVHSADDGLNAIIAQALADIFMLTVAPEPGTPHAADRFVYAGIPSFATIFGRDALITSRAMLTFPPGLARRRPS